MADVRRAIDDVGKVVRDTTPALMRFMVPSTRKFSICMPLGGAEVVLMNGGQEAARFPIDQLARDDAGREVFCKHFLPDDSADDRWRVVAPAQAQLLVLN